MSGQTESAMYDEVVVRAFIIPARRGRWLEALTTPGRRAAFLDRLNHCPDLDPRHVTPVAGGADVLELLRSRGAPPTCYVLSATEALDGCELPLAEAVAAAEAGGWGTIISCLPGRLAYYFDECGERRLLLERGV